MSDASVFGKQPEYRGVVVLYCDTINPLSGKHKRTLAAVFDNPVRSNIQWSEIESMLVGLGAEVSEGSGSRVRIALNGIRAVFHRPHPRKETYRGAVCSLRRFLLTAGIAAPGEE